MFGGFYQQNKKLAILNRKNKISNIFISIVNATTEEDNPLLLIFDFKK